jgi:hypothetical protein
MALLADAAVLLRARALLGRPTPRQLLAGLMPLQLSLELEAETITLRSPKPTARNWLRLWMKARAAATNGWCGARAKT